MSRLVLTGPAFAELAAKILGQGTAVRFRAHGRSMWPLIRDGDILTVEPVKMETLRVGDVVLHRTEPCGLVAHRLVARGVENGNLVLTTCGDVSPRVRDRVSAEQLLGRVVALERGKKAVRLDRGPWRLAGVLWAVLSPFGALLIQWVRRARRVVFRRPRCTRTAENGAAIPRGTDD